MEVNLLKLNMNRDVTHRMEHVEENEARYHAIVICS